MATTFGDVYQSQRFGSMLVIAKGRIAEGKWLIRSNTSQVYSFLWQYNGDSLRIFSVDLISDIIVARDPLLRQLNRLAVEYQPDLIVGDFNAPRRQRSPELGFQQSIKAVVLVGETQGCRSPQDEYPDQLGITYFGDRVFQGTDI